MYNEPPCPTNHYGTPEVVHFRISEVYIILTKITPSVAVMNIIIFADRHTELAHTYSLSCRFLFKKLLMFERSGVAKKGVAGLLPSSVLKSRSRPSMAHTVSQPTDTPTSNQRLAVGYVGPYPGGGVTEEVTSSNGTKRTSGHLSKYGSRLKRQKGPEVGSRSSGVDREIGEDGSHSRNKKTKNWGEGKKEESVAEKGNPRVSGILNSSKDQNKLLMSDSSENSEGEWNEDSDDGNGKLFVSSSNLKHRRKPGRGRGESGKKRGGHNDAAAKAKQEEEIDGDGGEWVCCTGWSVESWGSGYVVGQEGLCGHKFV